MDQTKNFSHKDRLKQVAQGSQFDDIEDSSERIASQTEEVKRELQKEYEPEAPRSAAPSDDHDKNPSQDQAQEDKTPWQREIEKAGLSPSDARVILDTIILRGEPYRKRFKIYRDVYATFQSRSFEALDQELWFAEKQRPHFDQTLRTIRTRHQLAQMLYALGDQKNPDVYEDEELKDRLIRVNTMDHTYVSLLVRKMYKFQSQIEAAFTPGFEKHF